MPQPQPAVTLSRDTETYVHNRLAAAEGRGGAGGKTCERWHLFEATCYTETLNAW